MFRLSHILILDEQKNEKMERCIEKTGKLSIITKIKFDN